MEEQSTYKERLVQYFENNKFIVWLFLILSGIIFVGKVISTMESWGLNNSAKEEKCNQLDKELENYTNRIINVFSLESGSINLLQLEFDLKQYKLLINEGENNDCYEKEMKIKILQKLKSSMLSQLYSLIKDSKKITEDSTSEKDLAIACRKIVRFFTSFEEGILSNKEIDVFSKVINILENED